MDNYKRNILVVEDNVVAAKVVKILLESLGCSVDLVTDGQEAVNQVLQKKYNGVSMDIGLPTMSGLDACKAIRSHENKNNLPKVPIVAVTGNNGADEAKNYLAAGMQAVIDKPFTKEKAVYFLSFCK